MEEARTSQLDKHRVIAVDAKAVPAKDGINATFMKEVLKRAPFLIVGKTTPDTLPSYDVENDFAYFFYSDQLASTCCLTGKFLRRGHKNNAKSLYPDDYGHFFREDADVVSHYAFPSAKTIVESWRSPGVESVIIARKTSVRLCGRTYILGTKATFDDVELGITAFRAHALPHEMSDPDDVPLRWFEGAFEHLPDPTAVIDEEGNVLRPNALMRPNIDSTGAWQAAITSCMKRAKYTNQIDKSKEAWEFSRVKIAASEEEGRDETASGHKKFRVWLWKPSPSKNLYVICFREHHSGLPGLIEKALV